ncbi:MAG: type II secretion system F family protein [Candidatus Omnitrophica bacterium]|nr:type II secretion system F family protein [Candidatus Omnitrophota bacterium]
MPKFIYKAKKSPSDVVEGTIVADNKGSAIQKISNMGYYLLSIDEYIKSRKALEKKSGFFRERASLKDITNFTRQLSDLLEGGLTIVKALDILHDQTENRRLKDVVADVRDFCIDGNSLSTALARHPKIFSNLFVSMVRSGETGGALENILKRLSDFNEKQLEIQTKIRSALAYPILMSAVGGITIVVLLTFVIPKMITMFGDLGQNLPIPTLVLIGISNTIKRYWWLILFFIILASFIFMRLYKTRDGRLAIDNFKMNMPLFGNLIKKVEIARFTRTLATLLNNGVPILQSLDVVLDTVNNAVVKKEVNKVSTHVRGGANLAFGFSKSSIIPPFVVNMIAVGEESGRVEKSLFKIAESYERETDAAVKVMMSLLEPVLILVLGLVVGFIVISMLLPIFEINFLVG